MEPVCASWNFKHCGLQKWWASCCRDHSEFQELTKKTKPALRTQDANVCMRVEQRLKPWKASDSFLKPPIRNSQPLYSLTRPVKNKQHHSQLPFLFFSSVFMSTVSISSRLRVWIFKTINIFACRPINEVLANTTKHHTPLQSGAHEQRWETTFNISSIDDLW